MGSGSEIASAADKLPLPLSNAKDWAVRNGADFSFAGLKTAVRQVSTKVLLPPLTGGEAEVALELGLPRYPLVSYRGQTWRQLASSSVLQCVFDRMLALWLSCFLNHYFPRHGLEFTIKSI